jgi:multidrug efflux pump subunit AcrB
MWITKTSIKNPVFATMVMVALIVLGLASYRGLGVESMPNVEIPGAWIEVNFPGASPEQVENDITRPLEDAVNTVSGVKKIMASSWEGRGALSVEFELSTNMDKAMTDLRDKIARVRPSFPKDAKEPFIIRFEGENAQSIVDISLMSDTRSLRELSTLTEQVISKRMQGVAGVGQIRINGKTNRQILINMKPDALAGLSVGVDEVLRAIQSTNANLPAGNISFGASERLVRVEGKIKDARGFNKIIVARRARKNNRSRA